MLSLPCGPHGTRPASRRTDSAQRCDVHAVVVPSGSGGVRWCSRVLGDPEDLPRPTPEGSDDYCGLATDDLVNEVQSTVNATSLTMSSVHTNEVRSPREI